MIPACSEVVTHDEFFNLSAAQVCHLISSDRLTVSTEEQVYVWLSTVVAVTATTVHSYKKMYTTKV